jgi:hypothetical protein
MTQFRKLPVAVAVFATVQGTVVFAANDTAALDTIVEFGR